MNETKFTEYLLSVMMVVITIMALRYVGGYISPEGIATPTESLLGLFLLLFIINLFVKNLPKASEGVALVIEHFLPEKVKTSLNIK